MTAVYSIAAKSQLVNQHTAHSFRRPRITRSRIEGQAEQFAGGRGKVNCAADTCSSRANAESDATTTERANHDTGCTCGADKRTHSDQRTECSRRLSDASHGDYRGITGRQRRTVTNGRYEN